MVAAVETEKHIALIGKLGDNSIYADSLYGQKWSMRTFGMSVDDAKNNFVEGSLVGGYFRRVDGFQSKREVPPSGALEALLAGKGATYHSSITYRDSSELWAEIQGDLRQKGLPAMPDCTIDFYVVGAVDLLH